MHGRIHRDGKTRRARTKCLLRKPAHWMPGPRLASFCGTLLATLLLSEGEAFAQATQIDPEEGKLRLLASSNPGGVADEYWVWMNRRAQVAFRCEHGFWSESDFFAGAEFCDTDGAGGYKRDHTDADDFLSSFTVEVSRKKQGPVVESVIGSIKTVAFDIALTPADPFRQCTGFRFATGLGFGLKQGLFAKLFDFYACGKSSSMAEDWFLTLLGGFGVEGEFERMVE